MLEVLSQLFSPLMLGMIVLGSIIGVVFGAIPGLTGTIGVSLLLPISFTLPPHAGLLLLGGIYMGAMFGGSITGVLLHIPGAPEATFTAVEGFPMTKKGESERALYLAVLSSGFGGIVGVLALIFFTPSIARIAVAFGPPEMFLLGIAGLTVIGALAGGSDLPKSFFSAAFGIVVSAIGVDNMTAGNRFNFGIPSLKMGFDIIAVVLGMFAISEMLLNVTIKEGKITNIKQKKISRIAVVKEIVQNKGMAIRSTLIGVLIGALPGVGATTASFVAYGNAKTLSKHPEEYGNGSGEGIIANECANNAVVGSCLIPLLSLGIPGSGTAAIMLGALTVHGIIPGPELFTKHATVAYTFMYGMLLTVVVMLVIGLFGVNLFKNVVKIDLSYIIPLTIAFSLMGAYANRNSVYDMTCAVIMAFVAVLMKKNSFPIAPMVLGVVLGPIIETNLRTSIVLAGAAKSNLVFFLLRRPICIVLLILVGLLLFFMVRVNKRLGLAKSRALASED